MEYLVIKLITFVLIFIGCISIFYHCFKGLNKQIKDESNHKEKPIKNEVNVKSTNSSDHIYVLKPSGTIIKNGKVIQKDNDCYRKENITKKENNDGYHKENTIKSGKPNDLIVALVEQQIPLHRKYTDNVKQQIKEGKVSYNKETGKPKYIFYNPDNLEIEKHNENFEEIPHDPSYPVRRPGVKYNEVLKDERWKKRRNFIIYYRANNICQCCKRKFEKHELAIHHKYYVIYPNGDVPYPWNYPDSALMCLCHECHNKIHNEKPIPVYYRKHPLF